MQRKQILLYFSASNKYHLTQYLFTRMRENKAYVLNVESEKIPVYCHMKRTAQLEACGGGGWTLVMKIDGKKVAAAKKQLYLLFIKNILHMFMIGSNSID